MVTSKLAKKYGGPHLGLSLTATGGNLRFDCASVWFSAPLKLDAAGRFSAPGTYRQESGARPPRGTNATASRPVTYKGQVTGSKMSIRYKLDGNTEHFTLNANSDGQLMRCM